ncbi:penicillin-insensitive murein endopeptidase [Methylobacterium terricola]|uniref:Penicillin-insensitive murein endopeptidase n=1 Tax=Methylobacterium terricola TaxID=2583531 RepID=A0A5C4LGB2_9HYPH|nr:penicillin-insensitive murein endopeptidase [Methylobacterium terricola]TNC12257.1 penicillin-insensitive murein endopeptidase [Methylobacterium terricola]
MNAIQVASAFRALIIFVGGALVTRGWLTAEQVSYLTDASTLTAVVGAAMAIGSFAYGVWTRRPAGLLKAAASLPEVDRITVAPTAAPLAAAVPSPKVTVP